MPAPQSTIQTIASIYQPTADGTPYQYSGHWSWIYVFINEVESIINGTTTTIMEWLAAQSLNK
jgi:hypothetical protein